MSSSKYSEAGVDIDKGNALVETIGPIASATHDRRVLGGLGGFSSHYEIDLERFPRPVLVSSTDGVGTKLAVAGLCGRHDTIGIDLVAMCVNDLVVSGAVPLFFLDYFSTGHLEIDTAAEVVKGIAEGCRQAGCSLVGGETAEMPGLYRPGDYDLAGFVTGMVNRDAIIDGSRIKKGDRIIGLASSGLHSNGFSLVRKICFTDLQLKVDDYVAELGRPLGEELLEPTRIYVKNVLQCLENFTINGMVHNTGGGFIDNIPRILPDGLGAEIDCSSWQVPAIFRFLQEQGGVAVDEMYRTFNMGIGLMVIVSDRHALEICSYFNKLGERATIIGSITDTGKVAINHR
ncbi:MAG: phosphoribosylformylglycinamidine cyclo-ligase [Deltaproteobacteria bacterium]|nr:MAG: phosphoribosylformylglycinamidine cyclo-ligase [Deltaproteobacteria bacterium]